MPTQPEDHKKKPERYKFVGADGKTHSLPFVTAAQDALTGREVRDAALGGELDQIALMYKTLEATQPSKKALDALYDLPSNRVTTILTEWAEHGDGDGASLGKSLSSSD